MPATEVIFYRDERGEAPVADWLRELRRKNRKAFANCVARIEQLAAEGHELRRPAADILRDGVYELRAKHRNVQYRILYFFHPRSRNVVILAHAIVKEGAAVPPVDIERTIQRKRAFETNPGAHTYEGDLHDG